MIVSQILGQKGADVATVPTDATVADVLAELREYGIGALVVSDDGRTIPRLRRQRRGDARNPGGRRHDR